MLGTALACLLPWSDGSRRPEFSVERFKLAELYANGLRIAGMHQGVSCLALLNRVICDPIFELWTRSYRQRHVTIVSKSSR